MYRQSRLRKQLMRHTMQKYIEYTKDKEYTKASTWSRLYLKL